MVLFEMLLICLYILLIQLLIFILEKLNNMSRMFFLIFQSVAPSAINSSQQHMNIYSILDVVHVYRQFLCILTEPYVLAGLNVINGVGLVSQPKATTKTKLS